MLSGFFRSRLTYFFILAYLGLVIWWIEINGRHLTDSKQNFYFGLVYALVALVGGLNGLRLAQGWGGLKSVVGKGVSFFSLGLLSLGVGQLIFSYYNIVANVEVPFPSVADFFYFSIIILYILGSITLFKASGSRFTLSTLKGRFYLVVVPLIALTISYFLLLKKLSIDFSSLNNGLITFLSYSSPLGGAIYISIAALTFQLSRKLLGGVMRKRILFLIAALILEYLAEYVFAYRAAQGTYYNGDIDDLVFATAVIIMSLGLNSLRLNKQREEQ